MIRYLGLSFAVWLAALGPAAAQAPLWTLEPGSKVGFIARQAGAPVEGVFETFTAEIRFDSRRQPRKVTDFC